MIQITEEEYAKLKDASGNLKNLSELLRLPLAEIKKLCNDLHRWRSYATYCKTKALSAERPLEFSEWEKQHAQPRTVVT